MEREQMRTKQDAASAFKPPRHGPLTPNNQKKEIGFNQRNMPPFTSNQGQFSMNEQQPKVAERKWNPSFQQQTPQNRNEESNEREVKMMLVKLLK